MSPTQIFASEFARVFGVWLAVVLAILILVGGLILFALWFFGGIDAAQVEPSKPEPVQPVEVP